MSNLEDARLAYEVARGSRCSDNHWYNTRRLLARHGLEVQDLRRYAICSGIRFAIPNFKKNQLIEPERVSLRSSRN